MPLAKPTTKQNRRPAGLFTTLVLLMLATAWPKPAGAQPPHAPDPVASSPVRLEMTDQPGGPARAAALSRRDILIASLTIFVLAVFVGFEVITKVPPTLHTPLMSGSNAISGITIVGALIAAGDENIFASLLGLLAVILATINVVGGFLVTGRMLAMFQTKPKKKA